MSDETREALARVTAALPAGEPRPGQVAMAEAVAKAIDQRRHLIVQAGTGTGKSLAYLVPTIVSGAKVVVATATKALQDQLATKDLPFLAEHLGVPFSFAVVKGRSNYLCRQRALEVAGGGEQLALDADGADLGPLSRQVRRLLEWGVTSPTGERGELPFEPSARAWSQVSVSATECPGAGRCPVGAECFAELARERAEAASVVVVNTHLYCTHLASGGHVLPAHDVVVFDEAHALEDVAASALGIELGGGRLRALARVARPLAGDAALAADVAGAGDLLEEALAGWRGRRLPHDLAHAPELAGVIALIGERVRRLMAAVRRHDGDDARRARAVQAASHVAGDLAVLGAPPAGTVAWVEGPPHAPVVRTALVDVGPMLAERLWGDVTCVLTSATVPPGLAARLGIVAAGDHDDLDVGSPFRYEEQGLLYCAAHLPDPRHPDYQEAMHAELEALIRAAGGRTLALFTSWRAMDAAAAALRDRLPWRVLTQSDLPKPALVEAFSTDETSCLFATMSFWQGVDVPGPSLSLVVVDRIPFPRPDEPLADARRDRAGAGAFGAVDLPRAATLLAQGAGRLIRSASDRGVVAVLDARLARAGYRWDLVRALPPMRRTRHRVDVERFLSVTAPV